MASPFVPYSESDRLYDELSEALRTIPGCEAEAVSALRDADRALTALDQHARSTGQIPTAWAARRHS